MSTLTDQPAQPAASGSTRQATLEWFFVFLLCYLFAGGPTPNVNEAHYLGKAKHYWNPTWCEHDFFLNTQDAHLVFNWVFGWVTMYCSLPMAAWIGRFVVWAFWSWAFVRLSRSLWQQRWLSVLLSAVYLTVLQHGHLAGEWVIGGVEAKVFAHALVLLGVREIVLNRWHYAWPLFGLAASFHVLVGGWAVVAGMIAVVFRIREIRFTWKHLGLLILGGILSLPGLLPGLWLTQGVEPVVVAAANQIYVYDRLSHHLVFSHIYEANFLRFSAHAVVVAAFLVLAGVNVGLAKSSSINRLSCFVSGTLLIAFCGIALDMTLSNDHREFAAKLLRFYWFRMSDAMVPLGIAILVGQILVEAKRHWPDREQAMLATTMCLVALAFAFTMKENHQDRRPGADKQLLAKSDNDAETARIYGEWRRVCDWIDQNTPEDATFLTPYHQQTFKWYANRAEVANWKDVPQDSEQLVLWWDRMRTVYFRIPEVRRSGLLAMKPRRLLDLCNRYNAQYIVVDRRYIRRKLPFVRRYPSQGNDTSYYEVYQVFSLDDR